LRKKDERKSIHRGHRRVWVVLYGWFAGQKEYNVDTPFGKPSASIVVGTLENTRVAFSRGMEVHHLMPGEVPYRANIYALKSLAERDQHQRLRLVARKIMRTYCHPRQYLDNTKERIRTFFGAGMVAHGVADPFCNDLRTSGSGSNTTGAITHRGGSFIVIEGPRFSTKAESNAFRAWGMSIIGMTAAPEAFLAREAELCYATMAHVTDYDVWHENESPVTVEMVIQTLNKNTQKAQEAIHNLVRGLKAERPCECGQALSTALITDPKVIPAETRNKLDLLVGKYLK
jgi:5'-methylthioadenosine phosphorylase